MARPSRNGAVLAALRDLGGVAHHSDLIAASSRAALRAVVERGQVTPLGGGYYAAAALVAVLADPPRSPPWSGDPESPSEEWHLLLVARLAVARAHSAALSQRCAAQARGWATWTDPDLVELAVPPDRRVRAVPSDRVAISRRELSREELADGFTSPASTVVHCARDLPLVEALAVADSALRSGQVDRGEMRAAATTYRGRRSSVVRLVAEVADGRAANPLESAMRAAVLPVAEAAFVPQVEIREGLFAAQVDLADDRLRLVLEADSYEFHGTKPAFEADCRRYDELVARGWRVLRFTHQQVSKDPDWVREMTRATALSAAAERG